MNTNLMTPEQVFADPVSYLRDLGIESELVGEPDQALPVAA